MGSAERASLQVFVNDYGNTGGANQVDTKTISISVANNTPSADAGGPYDIDEGDSLTLDGTGSDDPDSDTLTYRWDLDNNGSYGEETGSSRSLTWAQLKAYFTYDGTYTIGLQVDDGDGGIDTATTTLTINNLNPTANNDENTGFITDEDSSFTTANVLGNDTDPGNDSLTITGVDTFGTVGTVTNNGDGTFSYDPNGSFEYLKAGEQTTDTFTYTISDGEGGTDTATVTITVQGRNDAPVIQNNTLTLNEGDSIVLSSTNLSSTDIDLDNLQLTYTVSGLVAGHFENGSGTTVTSFTQQQINNGEITFIHDGTETPPAYNITVSDGETNTGPDATTINFTTVNNPPTISNIADQNIDEDTSTTVIPFTIDDQETPAAALVVTATSNNQTLIPDGNIVLGGTGANRTIQVIPAGHQHGGPVTITVTVSDGARSEISTFDVVVNPLNDAPDINNNNLTLNEGDNVVLTAANLSSTDIETDDQLLTYSISGIVAGHFENDLGATVTSFTQQQINNGEITFVHDGSETTPAYEVTVNDGTMNTGPQAANINFTAINDRPTISTIADQRIDEDTSTPVIDFTIGDEETSANTLIVSATSNNQTLIPDGNITLGGSGVNRTIQVTPESELSGGPVIITVSVSDGDLNESITFEVIVDPINDPPALTGTLILGVSEGGSGSITTTILDASDIDNSDTELSFTVTGGLVNGQLERTSAPGTAITSFNRQELANGLITYVHNGSETTSDTISLNLTDGTVTLPVTINVNISATLDPPSLVNNTLTLNEGETVSISTANLSATDDDTTDSNLTFVISGLTNGQFERTTAAGTPITTFTLAEVISGSIQFVHDGAEIAPAYLIEVTDGNSTDGPVTAAINFTAQNDLPTITAIADQTIPENGTTGTLGFTIGDDETIPASLNVSATSSDTTLIPNANLILGGSGANRTLAVTPTPGMSGGPVTITVTVSDGIHSVDTTFTLNVTATNHDPDIQTTRLTLQENLVAGTSLGIVQVNDSDFGETFTWDIVGGTGAAKFSINDSTGEVTSLLPFDYEGRSSYTLEVEVTDSTLLTDTETITIEIQDANDAPVARADNFDVIQGDTINIDADGVLLNDSDQDRDILSAELVSSTDFGVLTFNTDGSFSYETDAEFHSSDSFTYRVTDGLEAGTLSR